MSNFAFNISKGRGVELYTRAKNADPATSALLLVPLSTSATQAAAQDADTLTQAIAAGMVERTSGGWVRKTLAGAQLTAPAPDDTNDRYSVGIPSVTWTTPAAGNNITGLLVCYRNATADPDTSVIPITHHDLVFTADGQNFVLNAGNFLQAT